MHEGNEAQVRRCFQDKAGFERFRAGDDYHYGLSDVTDEEFRTRYDRLQSALQELVTSGQVMAGAAVRLETVPMSFLRNAPLIDETWIDREAVELAEWGAVLKSKGYRAADSLDEHPLAWDRLVDAEGNDAGQAEVNALRRPAAKRLTKFPGRVRDIDGLDYLHFEDYCGWRGRKVRGRLRATLERGFVTTSWNDWFDGIGAEGVEAVFGIRLGRLACYVDSSRYHACEVDEPNVNWRRLALDSLYKDNPSEQQAERIQEWRVLAERLFFDLHSIRLALESISERYFEGQPVLFSDEADLLKTEIEDLEAIVEMFNEDFAQEGAAAGRLELGTDQNTMDDATAHRERVFVDMAKSDTLKSMGELRAAANLLAGYIEHTA